MAEGFFKSQLATHNSTISISSAGISALIGYPAETQAQSTMSTHGIDISQHRARQLTDNMVRESDLIFVMSLSQLNHITRQFWAAKGKIFLIGHWQKFEIEDPYQQSDIYFEKVFQQLGFAWQDWKSRIL